MMTPTKTAHRARKPTADQIAQQERIDAIIARIHRGIADGTAYVDTFRGRRRVIGYSQVTGTATTTDMVQGIAREYYVVATDAVRFGR